jgi:signal transduction histidine kinase
MRLRLRLRQQLLLSYVPVLLIPILVIGLITQGAAERGLTVLVTEQGNRLSHQLAVRFTNYYGRNHSWTHVDELFNGLLVNPVDPPPGFGPGANGNAGNNNPRSNNNQSPLANRPPPLLRPEAEQIILADTKGMVIAANAPEIVGRLLEADNIARGVPIYFEKQQVGTLVVGAALGVLDEAQQRLLDSVNTAVLIAAGVSALVTVVIGVWFSGRISAPIAALTRGVGGLAGGQWSKHIPVYNADELGELTQAFNQMADDLVRQQNLRKQLMADIAHDLRTPLSVMTLEIEGIKAGLQTPAESAQSLQDEVEWLSRLVNDVHTLSLIDAGQLPIQMEPVNLTVFLESVYRHWQKAAEQQERALILTLAPGLPIVMIDSPRMRQVLGNLINNAIQHTPAEAAITLQAVTDDRQVFIRVMDTGQGIPAEALPHLFERFYRVDKGRNRKMTTGSGLGLSIAHQLTALQGGELTVQSAAGQGTTFTIRLPVHTV